jgi:hypothetical protein
MHAMGKPKLLPTPHSPLAEKLPWILCCTKVLWVMSINWIFDSAESHLELFDAQVKIVRR